MTPGISRNVLQGISCNVFNAVSEIMMVETIRDHEKGQQLRYDAAVLSVE